MGPPMDAYFNLDLELASSELAGERVGKEHSSPKTVHLKIPGLVVCKLFRMSETEGREYEMSCRGQQR